MVDSFLFKDLAGHMLLEVRSKAHWPGPSPAQQEDDYDVREVWNV